MGTTPKYQIPYVDAGSTVATFPTSDRAQAEAVEALVEKCQPYCFAYANAVQSMTTSAETAMVFNAAEQNVAGMWSAGAATDIAIPEPGLYDFILGYSFAPHATGSRIVVFRVDVTTVRSWNIGGAGTAANLSGTINFRRHITGSTSKIQLRQFQSSGAALNTQSASYPFIQVQRLSAPPVFV